MSDIVQCPYCDEDIKARAKKCKHCGEMLDGPALISAEPPTLPRAGKGEIEYYKDSHVRVTSSLIKIGEQTYQASNISSVLIKRRSRNARGCMGEAGVIFLGYAFFMGFFMANVEDKDSPMMNVAMLGPFLFIAALIYAAVRPKPYELRLTTSGLEKCALSSMQREALEPIAVAIEKAFRGN